MDCSQTCGGQREVECVEKVHQASARELQFPHWPHLNVMDTPVLHGLALRGAGRKLEGSYRKLESSGPRGARIY
jgi:hypothetical protein